MELKDTLNLPKTSFPMKANLAQREPEILEMWEKQDIYKKVLEAGKGKPDFILHDGPPYANGDIHVGHTLNKVLKDIIVKYKSMRGFRAPFVPGWDTHGQPIEHNVIKTLGKKRASITPLELRKLSYDYAMKFFKRQRDEFKRLGVRGDWGNPYLTMDPVYEATNIEIFGSLFEKGMIYKGRKPIHWCYSCETALAEAEIEYHEERSPSIYIKFKIKDDKGKLAVSKDVSFMVWTTTPWTLPANVALAIDPEGQYLLVESKGEHLIILKDLAEEVFSELERPYRKVKEYIGKELEAIVVSHPLFDKNSIVVPADFISHEQGTGVVHIAPGHGQEDYLIGLKYKLPMPMPVDDRGIFTSEAERLEGQSIFEGNKSITEDLKKRKLLLKLSFIEHSYPHCWRCRKPVIFRATEQWFISMDKTSLRAEALKRIKEVDWIPGWSQGRIEAMVSERPDWCISRQRNWGVPLPVFICKDCDESLVSNEIIKAVKDLFEKEGADSWYEKEAKDILPAGT
ncbi:MAG: isoleucine--tRNA ligase, partial [Actinobacteria bacterium]